MTTLGLPVRKEVQLRTDSYQYFVGLALKKLCLGTLIEYMGRRSF